ncbi:MAG: helix-hairpin-helix domain-containing protein [Bacteroidia bacterium]|nr:helix-hairpin-helix domain-containing protein [Bacteroidia bacterium]
MKGIYDFWKGYLDLKGFEQRGLLVIIILCGVLFLLPEFIKPASDTDSHELKAFQDLVSKYEEMEFEEDIEDAAELPFDPLRFDPNTVSRSTLLAMGLPPGLVKSIINYRKAGGQFRKSRDLRRMYGMTDEIFSAINGFVDIDSRKENALISSEPDEKSEWNLKRFNPNTVEKPTLTEMQLPTVFVKSLINYRNKGGVYRSMDDIKKLFGSTDELVASLSSFLIFETPDADESFESKSLVLEPQYFDFDPNHISQDSLELLGVSAKVAETWVKFRKSGAVFKKIEDLDAIYGLSADKIDELSPFTVFSNHEIKEAEVVPSVIKNLHVEINKANAEDFQLLHGVGPYYAKQLVNYREKLGGFHSIDQIRETRNFPDSVYQSILEFLILDRVELRQISVNQSSIKELQAHPYISYNQAYDLCNFISGIRRLRDVEDIIRLGFLTEEELKNIGPYFNFD